MARIEHARAAIIATGEEHLRSEGGRAPARSQVYRQARHALHTAEQARNRLLVDLVGPDTEVVPVDLVERLGLTSREAVHIVSAARTGSKRIREHVLGRLSVAD